MASNSHAPRGLRFSVFPAFGHERPHFRIGGKVGGWRVILEVSVRMKGVISTTNPLSWFNISLVSGCHEFDIHLVHFSTKRIFTRRTSSEPKTERGFC